MMEFSRIVTDFDELRVQSSLLQVGAWRFGVMKCSLEVGEEP